MLLIVTCRQLGACEFLDDEHFCTLEALLVQLGCKEVVIAKPQEPSSKAGKGGGGGSPQEGSMAVAAAAAGSVDARRLRDVLVRVGAMASERPKSYYSAKNLEQDLGKLLKV